jgi:RIO-like serine/threonine protein kinase
LAHLTENGRVIGMLLEKVDGDFASMDNITGCEAALRDLHRMGMVHGDVNRYNFIVDPVTSHIRMVDFEHVEEIEEEKARAEIASLPNELTEETNRGRACPINL